MIINNFSAYVVPLFKDINHPALIQEWNVSIDAVAYKNILMLTCLNLLIKKKFIVMIETCTGQPQ